VRLTWLAWLLVVSLVGAVVAWPFSQGLSLALGALFGLLVLAAVADVLGSGENVFDVRDTAERRRSAPRRPAPGRDWDRKAPDHADEPQDTIFERERKRRGLG
jgi:hypothetical protein